MKLYVVQLGVMAGLIFFAFRIVQQIYILICSFPWVEVGYFIFVWFTFEGLRLCFCSVSSFWKNIPYFNLSYYSFFFSKTCFEY